ncbi:MAG TPA: sterol desaturase family protein [Gammaproteobacteria bacterium]|nr:sterol desaturase family protein [Gammaproteobacteria bacterium]
MSAEDIPVLLIPLTFLVMLAGESLFATGRPWPHIPWWRLQGIVFFCAVAAINVVLPLVVPPQIAAHHLMDASRLGLVGSIVVGYLVLSFTTALVHRAYHRYPLLWRVFHQLHHAPQRLDTAGAVVFTPQEMIVNAALSLLVLVFVLGLSPLAASITGYVATFYSLFQHFNVHTPRWIGVLIQRPESHGVHHRRGFHAYNYSDLPIWDMLWGTFRNPRRFDGDVGFEEAESRRIGAMLLARDVNAATLGAGSRGRKDPAGNPA